MKSNKHSIRLNRLLMFAGALAWGVTPLALAGYVPFPGKLAVNLLDVEAPNVIFVNFETWPGFPRSVRVILPGLAVPEDTPQSDDCEREKAQQAMAFTRDFLAKAGEIHVQDMRMETSAAEQGYSDILTDQGSLGKALGREGLARADSVPVDTSWCQ